MTAPSAGFLTFIGGVLHAGPCAGCGEMHRVTESQVGTSSIDDENKVLSVPVSVRVEPCPYETITVTIVKNVEP